MGDIMRPVPFEALLTRIFAEYQSQRSIFGIPEQQFYSTDRSRPITVFGETCATPLGPAAGPHTQLAQNIITAWLTGGRFIELKTVQILDRLEIEKPCIDAADAGFNTEWSTEFTLAKAWDEYLKAWFVLHLLDAVFPQTPRTEEKSFIFNMSVGYNLDGIKQPPMQTFIARMMDASAEPKFHLYRTTLHHCLNSADFLARLPNHARSARLQSLTERIPATLVQGVTLSTMHGCPPDEIEAICRYMLVEKRLNTFVKLNPTLLGYGRVREILDRCGFEEIVLNEESFAHDLQFAPAVAMLTRLMALAAEQQRGFGVKLTNTLGTVNTRGVLPGGEMYMSGRALFPLAINVAARLSRVFDGKLPISYSGGASQLTIRDIFETGIRPITLATDLLKPGGYLRLGACLRELEQAQGWEMTAIDVARLDALAERAITMTYTQKGWKPDDRIEVASPLPATDCYVAPCVSACAIKQDIPEYIRLLGEGRYADALALIYQRNALPAMTGHICDHQCQYNCTRLDYESAVNIRELKKVALEKGWQEYQRRWHKPAGSGSRHPVAVMGAGPAGLAAGYFLARAGHPVTLFEREASAGGVVKNIIPPFRIPPELIEHDIDFVVQHGVRIVYGCDSNLTVAQLQKQGFHYVLVATGADKGRAVALGGDNPHIHSSLAFLRAFHRGEPLQPGKHVAIIGAGNTAMDCARAALRIPGVERATVVYRRSRKEMPAWREEYEEARRAGVEFAWLNNPEQFAPDGTLTLRVMQLGEADAAGRRQPQATEKTRTMQVDSVITAIGEQQDNAALAAFGLPVDEKGRVAVNAEGETRLANVFLIGDVQNGPASIVAAIGNARRAAEAILARESLASHQQSKYWSNVDPAEIYQRKGNIVTAQVDKGDREAFVAQEASRCLACNYICSKCVDVCPNRANISLPIPGFNNRFQTLHLDAWCNECGNCAQFCPWQGKPYQDKVTLFSLEEDFLNSRNPGFFIDNQRVSIRQHDQQWQLDIDEGGHFGHVPPQLEAMCRIIGHVHQYHPYLLSEVEQ